MEKKRAEKEVNRICGAFQERQGYCEILSDKMVYKHTYLHTPLTYHSPLFIKQKRYGKDTKRVLNELDNQPTGRKSLKGMKINTGVTKKKITKNKDNDKTNQFRSGGDDDDEGGDLDEQNQKIAEQDAEAAEAAEKDENGNEAQEPQQEEAPQEQNKFDVQDLDL